MRFYRWAVFTSVSIYHVHFQQQSMIWNECVMFPLIMVTYYRDLDNVAEYAVQLADDSTNRLFY